MKAQGKRFLTDRGDEGGSVRWCVEADTSDIFSFMLVEADLIITDCYKTITLDFSTTSYKSIAKRIAKVDGMIAELTEFKAALQQAESRCTPKKLYY